jgi:hypothetical protein
MNRLRAFINRDSNEVRLNKKGKMRAYELLEKYIISLIPSGGIKSICGDRQPNPPTDEDFFRILVIDMANESVIWKKCKMDEMIIRMCGYKVPICQRGLE